MSDIHSKIIAAAAKRELATLGFRRQGRSRLWLADRGSWLNVVEFTPSRWSRSVSLTNAAHWLWVGAGFLSFNEFIPSKIYAEFESEDQFSEVAAKIAQQAELAANLMDQRFSSLEAVADFVVTRALSSPDRMGASWWGYEAGVASGLLGRSDEAHRFLSSLTDDRVVHRAAPLMPLINRPADFKSAVNNIVSQERARLELTALAQPAFQ